MPFADVVGQEEAIRTLQGAVASGHVAHAYLFHGPPGTGKSFVAQLFARAVNCERDGDACEACPSCLRALHGNHPDIRILSPGTEKGENVGIQQMREMRADVHLRPRIARRKVYIVPEADRLSPPACHTVLKTLEEPPPYVTIILIAPDLAEILPTVISRCQLVRFTAEPVETVCRALIARGIPRETAAIAAAYTEGRFGAALSLAQDKSALALRAKVLDIITSLPTADRRSALRLAEDLAKLGEAAAKDASKRRDPETQDDSEVVRDELSEPLPAKQGLRSVIDVAVSWYRDILVAQHSGGTGPIRNVDRLQDLRSAARTAPTRKLLDALDFLVYCGYCIERNANPRLVLEQVVLKLLSVHR
ncbi:MAG: DNA polymerase III subunit [Armatimonadota bacterium]